MRYTLMAVSSITYAMKAKRILNNMGYYCEIERTPKNLASGCGYSIRIKEDPAIIQPILTKNGIAIKDKTTVNK